jgi:hypothetical protein
MNTCTQSKDAILILDGYMMALMHDVISFFYLFDPHARNSLVCLTLMVLRLFLNLENRNLFPTI